MKILDRFAPIFQPVEVVKEATGVRGGIRMGIAVLTAWLALSNSSLRAQTVAGSGSGNSASGVTQTGNWVGNSLPTTGADVSFGLSPITTVNYPASFTVGTITFSNTGPTARPDYIFSAQNSAILTVGGGITVNASGNVSGNGNVTLDSSLPIALTNGSHSVNVSSGPTLTVNGVVSDAVSAVASITKSGTGDLVLSGANTYSGGTTLSAGTLKVGSSSALGTGTLTMANGTTLTNSVTSLITLANPIALSGNVTLGGSNNAGGNLALTGLISGTATLNVTSSTAATDEDKHLTVFLRGNNSFSGTVNVVASSLILDSANALPSGVAVKLNDDAYIGYTENSFSTFAAFKSAITSSGSSRTGDTVIGIDSSNSASPRTVSDAIDLTGISSYLGTATKVTLSGTISNPNNGTSGVLGLTGVNGGYLKITSPLTALKADNVTANINSVKVGNSESEPGDVSYKGYIELSGASTYTGGTTFQSGYLLAGNNTALGTGTLTVSGTADTGAPALAASVNGVNLSNNISLSTNLQVGVPTTSNASDFAFPLQSFTANSLTLAGTISDLSGSNSITYVGAGTLNLTGTNTYSGGTTVSSGTLVVANPSGSATGSGAVSVASGATLQVGSGILGAVSGNITDNGSVVFNRSDSVTYAGIVSGTGTGTKLGAGTLTLTGANTFTGGMTISAGTLNIGGGTNSGSLAGNIVNNATLTFARANGYTFGGVISGTGQLSQLGTGTLTLSGANTFTGTTTIGAGSTLSLSNSLALAGSTLNYSTTGGSLTFGMGFSDPNATFGGLSGDKNLELSFNPDGKFPVALTVGGNNQSTTYSGNLSNSPSNGYSSLNKVGTGTLTLSGANTYAGSTTIGAGTIAISADNNLGAAPGSLTLNGGALQTTASLILNSNRGISLGASGGTLSPDTLTTLTYSGVISGSGALIKTGGGLLALSGSNTFTGGVALNSGQISVSSDNNLGVAGGALALNGGNLFSTTTFTLDPTRSVSLSGAQPGFSPAGGTTLTYGGVLSGTGSLWKYNNGTLLLSGANTYSGGTTLWVGTVEISADNNLGAASGGLTFMGGTLRLNNGLSSARNVLLNSSGGTIDTTTFSSTFSGAISGAGMLTKQGTGALTLSGASTLNTSVTINAGSLVLAPTGSNTGTNLNVNIAPGALFDIQNNLSLGSISGAGAAQIASGKTLTLNGVSTLSTVISGAGGVTFGSGSVVAANQTYSGLTTILPGGGLTLGNTTATGSFAGNVATSVGGGLIVSNPTSTAYSGIISGGGFLTLNGPGNLTLTGVNTYTGLTSINGGALIVGVDNAVPNSSVSVGANGTFSVANNETISSLNGSGTTTVASGKTLTLGVGGPLSAVISGAGNVAISGVVTVTANQTYTGNTILNDTGNNLTVNLGNGGTAGMVAGNIVTTTSKTGVQFNRSDNVTYGGVVTGGGFLNKNNFNTLTLTGQNTYASNTNVSGGTLVIGTTNALPTTTGLGLATGATLDVANDQTITRFVSNAPNSTIKIESGKTLTAALGSSLTTNSGFGTAFYGNITDGAVPGTGGKLVIGADSDGRTIGLYGTNTYTGGTTINPNGKLLLGNNDTNGTTGSILGNVLNNGLLIFNRGTTTTFSGVISGNGSVSQGTFSGSTTGDLKFTGNNTYTGGTAVYSKVLIVGDGATSGSIVGNVTLANNATVAFNRSDATSFPGVVSGTGSLFKAGAGTLTLTGQSTYAGNTMIGNTTVPGGTLTLGVANALPTTTLLSFGLNSVLAVMNNQTVAGFLTAGDLTSVLQLDPSATFTVAMPVANTSTTFAGTVNGSGTFAVNGAGNDVVNLTGSVANTVGTSVGTGATLNIASGGSLAGPVAVGSGSTLAFNNVGTQTFTNVISGAGSLLASAGITTLSAPNTYLGGTVITGGKIIVSNTSGSATGPGPVVVSNGGILGGSGIITGNVTLASGAIVSPGNSPGLLTVGPTIFASSASFALDINNTSGTPGTNWDILNITGPLVVTATAANPFFINLISLDSANNPGLAQNFNPAQTYSWQFVSTTGGITGFSAGAFQYNASQFQNSLAGGFFAVSQNGNNLFLNFTPVPEPSTWALLASGLGAFGFIAWRRRKKA